MPVAVLSVDLESSEFSKRWLITINFKAPHDGLSACGPVPGSNQCYVRGSFRCCVLGSKSRTIGWGPDVNRPSDAFESVKRAALFDPAC